MKRKRDTSIADVARAAGLSTATVSRALAQPEKLLPETRARVAQAIKALDYRPNISARNLRRGRTNMVLALLPSLANIFYSLVLKGIRDVLAARGYALVIGETENDPDKEHQYAEFILAHQVDGVLLLGGREPYAPGDRRHAQVPTVTLCVRVPGSELPLVETANRKTAALMTRHLIDLGHRRLGFVRGRSDVALEQDRFAGFQDALAAAGLKLDPTLVMPGDFSIHAGEAAARAYLAAGRLPEAVLACNDAMAMGLIRGLTVGGVNVPHDVSVAGFDDSDVAAAYVPALTTVRQARREIGVTAAQMLLDLMDGRALHQRHVVFDADLVFRESTGPRRATAVPRRGARRGESGKS
jgi:LacI family transcriptional regulator, repressor for deo operon, udp, cdd, tsx, nupC, and nupG